MSIFKPNKYWRGEFLVGEDAITEVIKDTAPQSLKKAYVVGNIMNFMDKRFYVRAPDSMDIFLYFQDEPDNDYGMNLEHTVEALNVNDLPVQVIAKNYHPFESKQHGGRDFSNIYPLYSRNYD